MNKWGVKSAFLLLVLCSWIYQQDRAQVMSDNKALAARTAANERAIGRLQEGKASREELKSAIETIARDNQRSRDDLKESMNTLRNDLVQRMDIIVSKK
jgi:hypothetical protein